MIDDMGQWHGDWAAIVRIPRIEILGVGSTQDGAQNDARGRAPSEGTRPVIVPVVPIQRELVREWRRTHKMPIEGVGWDRGVLVHHRYARD